MSYPRIHHTGIAAAEGLKMAKFFEENLDATIVSSTEFPEMKQISHMVKIGECELEIMEPTDPEGVVGKYLAKKGTGLHHISIEVKDIVGLAEKLEAKGIQLIGKCLDDPEVRYMFISPKSTGGILVEVCEYL